MRTRARTRHPRATYCLACLRIECAGWARYTAPHSCDERRRPVGTRRALDARCSVGVPPLLAARGDHTYVVVGGGAATVRCPNAAIQHIKDAYTCGHSVKAAPRTSAAPPHSRTDFVVATTGAPIHPHRNAWVVDAITAKGHAKRLRAVVDVGIDTPKVPGRIFVYTHIYTRGGDVHVKRGLACQSTCGEKLRRVTLERASNTYCSQECKTRLRPPIGTSECPTKSSPRYRRKQQNARCEV